MQVDISMETLDAAAMMIYRRWSEEYDYLKKVKEETHDGTLEWQDFHRIRIENHTREEAKWRRAKDEIIRAMKNAQQAV